jgi:hypothetical protein
LGTSDQVTVTGSVRVGPFTGDSGAGGGGRGLSKKTLKAIRFEGALKIPFAFTA